MAIRGERVKDLFTPVQRAMVNVLLDGMDHTFQELYDCLSDDLSTDTAVHWHVHCIRKKLRGTGCDVVTLSYGNGPRSCYRLLGDLGKLALAR